MKFTDGTFAHPRVRLKAMSVIGLQMQPVCRLAENDKIIQWLTTTGRWITFGH